MTYRSGRPVVRRCRYTSFREARCGGWNNATPSTGEMRLTHMHSHQHTPEPWRPVSTQPSPQRPPGGSHMPPQPTSSPPSHPALNTSHVSALTDDTNPWEIAAHLSMERDPPDDHWALRPSPSGTQEREGWNSACQRVAGRMWATLDGAALLLLLVWVTAILLHVARDDHADDSTAPSLPRTVLVLQGMVGGLLILRQLFDRCILLSSLGLGLMYAMAACYCEWERSIVRQYLEQHEWLQLHWLLARDQVWERLPIVLLVLALWELLVRWSYQKCRLSHMPQDTDLPDRYESLQETPRSRNRPWWWDRTWRPNDDDMDRPLLTATDDSSLPQWVSQGRRQRLAREGAGGWWRLPWHRRSEGDDNIRDDDSVDFASVQEEWAKRSQDDPYWWSKEEDQRMPPLRIGGLPDDLVDTRWAGDRAE